jgi:hypothetical protein
VLVAVQLDVGFKATENGGSIAFVLLVWLHTGREYVAEPHLYCWSGFIPAENMWQNCICIVDMVL